MEISGGSQPAKNHFISVPKDNYIRLYQIRDYGDNPIPVYIPEELASKRTEKGDILLARYGGSLGKIHNPRYDNGESIGSPLFRLIYLIKVRPF